LRSIKALDVGLLSANSAVKVKREWVERSRPDKEHLHIRHFISSLSAAEEIRLGTWVRGHWSVENCNHHKRDDSVCQEDRHRFRRTHIAQNLALTRNALLAIISFDEIEAPLRDRRLSGQKQLAINLILSARPFPCPSSQTPLGVVSPAPLGKTLG
jgi:predicted transposase YbfD/YdcC